MAENTATAFDALQQAMSAAGLSGDARGQYQTIYEPSIRWLKDRMAGAQLPFILGVSGAQGSGKSTYCALLQHVLHAVHGWSVVTVSVDDLYLTRAERQRLGEQVHPLCAIRGLPGSHDVALGRALFESLANAGPNDVTRIPQFNKAVDDRVPEADFDVFVGRPDLVLFEGWCLGAVPGSEWQGPINEREARDDPDARWYRWTEAQLAKYQSLWAVCEGLVMLKVPSFQSVVDGRWRQEQRLREQVGDTAVGVMTRPEVEDYVALFERKTTQLLAELPHTANLVFERSQNPA